MLNRFFSRLRWVLNFLKLNQRLFLFNLNFNFLILTFWSLVFIFIWRILLWLCTLFKNFLQLHFLLLINMFNFSFIIWWIRKFFWSWFKGVGGLLLLDFESAKWFDFHFFWVLHFCVFLNSVIRVKTIKTDSRARRRAFLLLPIRAFIRGLLWFLFLRI